MMGKVIMSGIVPQLVAPTTDIALGDIAEGSLVKINESGNPVEFYVACHNYESGLNGAGRTLLLRKNNYKDAAWDSTTGKNTYATSTIDTWFNSTYKALLDDAVKTAIGTTQFYYTVGGGDNTVTTLSRAVFTPSITEAVSGTSGSSSLIVYNKEGSKLPTSDVVKVSNDAYWTRTPYTGTDSDLVGKALIHVSSSGNVQYYWSTSATYYGYRPCFTLPATTAFDKETLELVNASVSVSVTDAYGGVSALLASKGSLTVGGVAVSATAADIAPVGSTVTVAYKLTGDIGAARTVTVNGTAIGSVHYAGDSVSTTIYVSDGDTITVAFT